MGSYPTQAGVRSRGSNTEHRRSTRSMPLMLADGTTGPAARQAAARGRRRPLSREAAGLPPLTGLCGAGAGLRLAAGNAVQGTGYGAGSLPKLAPEPRRWARACQGFRP